MDVSEKVLVEAFHAWTYVWKCAHLDIVTTERKERCLFHFDFVQSGHLEHGGRNLSSSESAYTWIEILDYCVSSLLTVQ